MQRIIFLAFIFGLSLSISAQDNWKKEFDQFKTAAKTNTGYLQLRQKISDLIDAAKDSTTNFLKVKNLFSSNKPLLTESYTKAGINPVKKLSVQQPLTAYYNRVKTAGKLILDRDLVREALATAGLVVTKIEKVPPSFFALWVFNNYPNREMPRPVNYSHESATSKISFTSRRCDGAEDCYQGVFAIGYPNNITVPNNPEIIKAKIVLEYSFMYTGWDTYGANTAMELMLRTGNRFVSTQVNDLPNSSLIKPDFVYPSGTLITTPTDGWKTAGIMLPPVSVTTDVQEIGARKNGTISFEGFVTPGSNFDVHLGIGYPPGTNKGLHGCYHYCEFLLKKMTVTFLKSSR